MIKIVCLQDNYEESFARGVHKNFGVWVDLASIQSVSYWTVVSTKHQVGVGSACVPTHSRQNPEAPACRPRATVKAHRHKRVLDSRYPFDSISRQTMKILMLFAA